ncbi:hypothetical protein PPERSA_05937 [Pseudocohnilembus persalinus]|uniref:Uncharacterized protein n=1 Tax=Pseudocohnilembus persalinus TaxID=266149 RepID=A0A0V0R454_PSEPJ|nr:hypothetical protein PPERSA_05937 [Pseudocohnilembus persalinus]|eukprot:KRX09268.1 hypothetical protein PPERSA_05937 [Pseudocohnilembus persalinus]
MEDMDYGNTSNQEYLQFLEQEQDQNNDIMEQFQQNNNMNQYNNGNNMNVNNFNNNNQNDININQDFAQSQQIDQDQQGYQMQNLNQQRFMQQDIDVKQRKVDDVNVFLDVIKNQGSSSLETYKQLIDFLVDSQEKLDKVLDEAKEIELDTGTKLSKDLPSPQQVIEFAFNSKASHIQPVMPQHYRMSYMYQQQSLAGKKFPNPKIYSDDRQEFELQRSQLVDLQTKELVINNMDQESNAYLFEYDLQNYKQLPIPTNWDLIKNNMPRSERVKYNQQKFLFDGEDPKLYNLVVTQMRAQDSGLYQIQVRKNQIGIIRPNNFIMDSYKTEEQSWKVNQDNMEPLSHMQSESNDQSNQNFDDDLYD